MNEQATKAWLSTRPESVQRLATRFPPGSSLLLLVDGKETVCHVMGYTEPEEGVYFSTTDPHEDYDRARETMFWCHMGCLPDRTFVMLPDG